MLKKRIPTIFGIILLLLGITAGVYLVELGPQSFTTRADPEVTPFDVRVTNVDARSFSVSWRTEVSTIGLVRYGTGPSNLDLSLLDNRDDSGGEGERSYLNHYVTVSGLSPNTVYYFVIVSGSSSTIFDDGGEPYSVTTAASLEQLSSADTSSGTVLFPNLSAVEGGIVYVSLAGGSLLSTLTGSTGTWVVPLSSIRTSDLSSYLDYDRSSEIVSIEVVGPDGSISTALTTTDNDSPVDDTVLGETYDFTSSSSQDNLPAESQFSLESVGDELGSGIDQSVTIDNLSEGEAVNTQNPEFIGEGPPGAAIEILVESEHVVSEEVVVGESGNWSWSPSSSLDPGEHTITLSWVDANGVARFLTRNFVVFAQGESELPAFEATPSATATPTPPEQSLTPTLAPTPTITPKPTPTVIASPSATPVPVATDPALPVPGTGMLSIAMALFGLGLSFLGSIIYIRQKSS